ncbi:MAG: hypothetical protein D6732_14195 [Methanobacteriota archaeon]|nr:MAG: hypothetical protein D6732_14195 [Euryarchaeota archaeon]
MSEEYVTISTTFSGKHAELIRELEKTYHCSKPAALRIFLSQYISGGLVPLNLNLRERISELLKNPLLQRQYGIKSVEGFVDFAVNLTLQTLTNALGDLRSPNVQMMLDEDELEVARTLVRHAETSSHYGGMTIETIASINSLSPRYVRQILSKFEENGWIMQTKLGRYVIHKKQSISPL